mgnify:CR=1 FL=1
MSFGGTMVSTVGAVKNGVDGTGEHSPARRRVWGTEEQPTLLRKAWWVIKGAFLTWS